ncbi:MAG TPA: S8 family serine peptidase [Actinocrinis sp.]|nr:S8 family serine peptidase [Actinocrinis sp.]
MRQKPARRPRRTRLGAALTALALLGAWSLVSADPAAADEISAGEWGRGFIHAAQADKVANGSGVTVGLLDSGVMTQRVNLAGQVTNGPDYAGGIERPGQSGWGEHGTCMASIIAGTGKGEAAMEGVAPGAHILAVRVIRDDDAPDVGDATTSDTPISDGIHYAVDHGVQVISMSIGGDAQGTDGDSSDEADAIRYALDHNVAVVIAAGNTGTEGNAISFPGADRGAITVAAVNASAGVADFSTTSWDVDVAAPGVNVTCDAPDSDDVMEIGDGTSQATAFTAGVVALVKSANKDLSPAQIRTILEQSAQDKPAGGRDDQVGFGIIDAQAAVALAAKTKALPENPATNAEVPTGHFGYGPTQVVAEAAPSFGALPRAVAGGAAIVLAGLILAFALLHRARRKANAALAGPAAAVGDVFVSETVFEQAPGSGPGSGEIRAVEIEEVAEVERFTEPDGPLEPVGRIEPEVVESVARVEPVEPDEPEPANPAEATQVLGSREQLPPEFEEYHDPQTVVLATAASAASADREPIADEPADREPDAGFHGEPDARNSADPLDRTVWSEPIGPIGTGDPRDAPESRNLPPGTTLDE